MGKTWEDRGNTWENPEVPEVSIGKSAEWMIFPRGLPWPTYDSPCLLANVSRRVSKCTTPQESVGISPWFSSSVPRFCHKFPTASGEYLAKLWLTSIFVYISQTSHANGLAVLPARSLLHFAWLSFEQWPSLVLENKQSDHGTCVSKNMCVYETSYHQWNINYNQWNIVYVCIYIYVCLFLSSITLWLFNIAMENCLFIDGLPIKNGDFPWLC